MFKPTNEYGVLWLFARNHEKLGFEEIFKIKQGPPDVIASSRAARKKEFIRIELEFNYSTVLVHYRALKYYKSELENPAEGEWRRDGIDWIFVLKNGTEKYRLPDHNNECYVNKDYKLLLFKKAKDFDMVVCWQNDIKRTFEEGMEVIELKTMNLQ